MNLLNLPGELIGYIIHLTELESKEALKFIKYEKKGLELHRYIYTGELKNGNPNGYGKMITATYQYNRLAEYVTQDFIQEYYNTIWIYMPLYYALYNHQNSIYFLK